MIKIGRTRIEFLISLGLFLAVYLVYNSIPAFEFNNYDDVLYVVENTNVQKGLTLSNIFWAFTSFSASNWHPVTWVSHMLDCSLFGVNPGGHHWTNLFLHSINSILLFLILLKMTGAAWRSAFVAALFAVHPLHVESVAWVAERKDLLSAFFAFLAIGAYCSFTQNSKKIFYWGAVLLFALGLMAKPMLVTLPFVLILLDWWPLGRLRPQMGITQLRTQFREKLPFLILSLMSSVLTIFAQQNAMYSISEISFQERLGNAACSYLRYLGKTFWPADLACFYPFIDIDTGAMVLAFVALCGLTLITVRAAKIAPYLPIGWFWYLGTLVPVIGIVQVGSQSMADRYTYIPLIGIFIILVWGAEAVARSFKYGRVAVFSFGAGILVLLAITANIQASHWKNSKALFTHALKVTSGNYIAHLNIGNAFAKEKDYGRAEFHFKEALKSWSDNPSAIYNLATLYYTLNRLDEANSYYKTYLNLETDLNSKLGLEAQANLAMALLKTGHNDEAESVIRKLLSSKPDSAIAHNNYGIILYDQGKLTEARVYFEKALSLDPENKSYRDNVQRIRGLIKNPETDEYNNSK